MSDVFDYIRKISQMSDRYGDKLISLMEQYDVYSLSDISEEQAREFYLHLINHRKPLLI